MSLSQRGIMLLKSSTSINKCGKYNIIPAFSSKTISSSIHSVSQLPNKAACLHKNKLSNELSINYSPLSFTCQPSSDCQFASRICALRCQQIHSTSHLDIFKSFSANENKASESEIKQDSSNAASNDTESAETTSGNQEQIDKLNAEITDLKAKSDDILDKYRRSIAENDNMRKRLTKQIEDAKIYGIQGFCKDLLEVADVLQKAVDAAKAEDERLGSSLAGGIELTQTQMHQVFNRHGLTQILPTTGETKFDPNMHEALFQIPVPDKDPNIVMDVQQIGYSLHGRTIRPAKVGVSKK